MWDKLSVPWRLCLEQAWQAYCADTIPIGAVIVAPNNTVIAAGRNHVYEEGTTHPLAGSIIAHAEIEALLQLRSADPNRGSYYLYTSVEPCSLCCGAIYLSGIRGVHYASPDSYAGGTNAFGSAPSLSRHFVEVHGPDPTIGALALTLIIDRFLQLPVRSSLDWRREFWLKDSPQAVALAHQTHRQGALKTAIREAWPVSEVINYLNSELQNVGGISSNRAINTKPPVN